MCKTEGTNRWVSSKGTFLHGESMEADATILGRVNAKPLDYHLNEKKPALESRNVLSRDLTETLVDYFFEYARNDNLGQIGMLWQDYAAKFGANCKHCIELAKQHSIAVDYAKTGVASDVPRYIMLPRLHPRAHWREKKHAPSFEDRKSIIGKLYNKLIDRSKQNILSKCTQAIAGRQIDRYGQVLSILEKSDGDSSGRLRLAFDSSLTSAGDPPSQTLLIFAREQRRSFERKIVAIMNEHGLRSEGEVFTGCIRKYHKMVKRRQFETSQDVLRRSSKLCDEFRDNFFRKVLDLVQDTTVGSDTSPASHGVVAGGDATATADPTQELDRIKQVILEEGTTNDRAAIALEDTAKRLAAAYYIVTYDPDARWIGDPDRGQILFGFPWIVADILKKNKADRNVEQ